MELRLQKFVASMERLSDIRNLDSTNPVVAELQHPQTGVQVTALASEVEPWFLGIPINTTWVVLDSRSVYYRSCLKFKSWSSSPDCVAQGLLCTWEPMFSYDEIFADVQYMGSASGVDLKGPVGDAGPVGPAGSQGQKGPVGDLPVVDYAYILANIS